VTTPTPRPKRFVTATVTVGMGLFGGPDEESDTDATREEGVGQGDPVRGGFEPGDALAARGKRVVDEEAGVVLYATVTEAGGYGLAAVPIEDTRLELSDDAGGD
jgi:hypothetical protein